MSIFKNTLPAAALFAAAAFAAEPAFAQNIVARDATSVANFFLAEGVEPSIETDSDGDPNIKVEYYGASFSIYYYGCDNGANCDAIQFFSGYNTSGSVRLVKINEWNAKKRFGRAYIAENGAARIEMDVFLGKNGLDPDDFAKEVGLWVSVMEEFEEFIDW
jgi:putative sensory transduction regulator